MSRSIVSLIAALFVCLNFSLAAFVSTKLSSRLQEGRWLVFIAWCVLAFVLASRFIALFS